MLRRRSLKYVFYSIIPAVVLFSSLEIIARIFSIANPTFITAPLPDEFRGLTEPHEELFWTLKPGLVQKEPDGTTVSVNSNGFRGPELAQKAEYEFRIISLGESSTFGAGVEIEQTYSARLADYLNEQSNDGTYYNVLNCGFSAYSSFQSLKFLELYGLEFEPDMVIVYNELNDYLPSALRNYGYDETAVYLTDMQLYESKFNSLAISIIKRSEFLKFLHYRYASFKTRKLSNEDATDPLLNIGIQKYQKLPKRIFYYGEEEHKPADLNETRLGQRVSEDERAKIFLQFQELCKEKGIQLLVIHPSYWESVQHECLLTDLCAKHNILMFDAYDTFHNSGLESRSIFLDDWHPSPMGHQLLARDLALFIKEHAFINN